MHDYDSPLILPDTSITKAMVFSDFRFRNLAKVSSPTAERTSLRKILVASTAMSAAILWRLKKGKVDKYISEAFSLLCHTIKKLFRKPFSG